MVPISKATNTNALAENIDSALKDVDQTSFSPAAFSALNGNVLQYLNDLGEESAKQSMRDGVDLVSVKHVDIACERLKRYSSNKIYKNLGVIGGISLGTCLSNVLPMLTSSSISSNAALFTLFTGLFGVGLLAVSFAKE